MNLLATSITAYQTRPAVRRGVKAVLRAYYRLTPGKASQRHGCPLAGRCSATGLEQARQLGTIAALPLILSRMAMCGSIDDRVHKPYPTYCFRSGLRMPHFCDISTGVDRFEWCIRE